MKMDKSQMSNVSQNPTHKNKELLTKSIHDLTPPSPASTECFHTTCSSLKFKFSLKYTSQHFSRWKDFWQRFCKQLFTHWDLIQKWQMTAVKPLTHPPWPNYPIKTQLWNPPTNQIAWGTPQHDVIARSCDVGPGSLTSGVRKAI